MIFKSDSITSLLIGKAVGTTVGLQLVDSAAANFLPTGEIAIISETGSVLTGAGITATTNPKIRLVQGTGNSEFKFSIELDSNNIINSGGVSYAAGAEQVTYVGNNSVTTTGSITVTAFADYKLTITYTHLDEMFAEQLLSRYYFYTTGAADTQLTIATEFARLINADEFFGPVAVVVNTGTNYGIQISGQALDFESPKFRYNKMTWTTQVSTEGFASTPIVNQVDASKGQGTYEQVKEMEYFTNGFDGAINRVHFPAETGFTDATVGTTYDIITVITEDTTDSSAISGTKPSRGKLMLALPPAAAQTAGLLTTLNAWLATARRPQVAIVV